MLVSISQQVWPVPLIDSTHADVGSKCASGGRGVHWSNIRECPQQRSPRLPPASELPASESDSSSAMVPRRLRLASEASRAATAWQAASKLPNRTSSGLRLSNSSCAGSCPCDSVRQAPHPAIRFVSSCMCSSAAYACRVWSWCGADGRLHDCMHQKSGQSPASNGTYLSVRHHVGPPNASLHTSNLKLPCQKLHMHAMQCGAQQRPANLDIKLHVKGQ